MSDTAIALVTLAIIAIGVIGSFELTAWWQTRDLRPSGPAVRGPGEDARRKKYLGSLTEEGRKKVYEREAYINNMLNPR